MRRILFHLGAIDSGACFVDTLMSRNSERINDLGIAYHRLSNAANGRSLDTVTQQIAPDWLRSDQQTLVLSAPGAFFVPEQGARLGEWAAQESLNLTALLVLPNWSDYVIHRYCRDLLINFDASLEMRQAHGGKNFQQYAVALARSIWPKAVMLKWQSALPNMQLRFSQPCNLKSFLQNNLELPEDLLWPRPLAPWPFPIGLRNCATLATMINARDIATPEIRALYREAEGPFTAQDWILRSQWTRWIEALMRVKNRQLFDSFKVDNRANLGRPWT